MFTFVAEEATLKNIEKDQVKRVKIQHNLEEKRPNPHIHGRSITWNLSAPTLINNNNKNNNNN